MLRKNYWHFILICMLIALIFAEVDRSEAVEGRSCEEHFAGRRF